MPKQAPTPLRQLVPEADRIRFDEAYNTEVVNYVLSVINEYIEQKMDQIDSRVEAEDKYQLSSWAYLQADAVGSKRALRNLAILLANNKKQDK